MPGKYLLDTNIVIALFDSEPSVRERLQEVREVFLSSVVLGELWYGAASSGRPEGNIARLQEFAASCRQVGFDHQTAQLYGSIKTELRRSGRPIPENDAWIAASARQHGLILVTRDRHFEHIERLLTESW